MDGLPPPHDSSIPTSTSRYERSPPLQASPTTLRISTITGARGRSRPAAEGLLPFRRDVRAVLPPVQVYGWTYLYNWAENDTIVAGQSRSMLHDRWARQGQCSRPCWHNHERSLTPAVPTVITIEPTTNLAFPSNRECRSTSDDGHEQQQDVERTTTANANDVELRMTTLNNNATNDDDDDQTSITRFAQQSIVQ